MLRAGALPDGVLGARLRTVVDVGTRTDAPARGTAIAVKRGLDAEGPGERHAQRDPAEDRELVHRCLQGDEQAFERLYLRHRGVVAGLVYRMLGPSPELEDLVQEVFLQVLRSLASFREEARFSTWLYRIALNVVLMQRRASARRPRLVAEEHAAAPLDAAPSAHEALETRRRVAALYELLGRLSDKKRTVFVLHELEGLTPARISEIVGAPVLTVRTRLFYARRDLARWMDEDLALTDTLAELSGQPEAASRAESGPGEPGEPGEEP
jgi:RNA polymerase sigma-70 factor (ECF subfamily)